MRKVKILLILGVFISVLPYLGFPLSLKNLVITLCGFAVIHMSYYFYRQAEGQRSPEEKAAFDNFSENREFAEILETEKNA